MIEYFHTFEELLLNFSEDFQREYGEKKSREIHSQVQTSKAVTSLMNDAISRNFFPNGRTICECLMSSRHFMFSKKPIIMAAGIFTLIRFMEECKLKGISYDQEKYLESAKSVIYHCRKM
ncbi:hypothetical protein [Algoriphagus algorifonticola]|uniref:hypothetical protein n=1 Tax=Algoriphagus algorifonticola TaxID=2593007 RepID=UPI0011A8D0B4|nr:hypothetical protein [Algoriphagus algorifonticola]